MRPLHKMDGSTSILGFRCQWVILKEFGKWASPLLMSPKNLELVVKSIFFVGVRSSLEWLVLEFDDSMIV